MLGKFNLSVRLTDGSTLDLCRGVFVEAVDVRMLAGDAYGASEEPVPVADRSLRNQGARTRNTAPAVQLRENEHAAQ